MFDSNIHNISTEYHSFIADDFALESLGVSSYSVSSLRRYLKDSPNDDVKDLFGGNPSSAFDSLVGNGSPHQPLSILIFNKDTNVYELKTGQEIFQTDNGTSVASNLSELLAKHNTNEWGVTDIDEDVKEVVQKIQGSYSGCIVFRPSFSIKFGSDTQTRTPLVKVYIKPKSQSDTTRSLAQNGSPLISSVPKRPTGAKYGWQGTQNKPIGVYQNPSEGGNTNPANAVAGNLRLTYNSAVGEWESGTQQLLARLLTDIEGIQLNDIAFDAIDDVPPEQFYDPESSYYMGQFTIGKALPISVEGGNPHMCGPNMTAAPDDGNKKEKIQVVNRSPRSFKKGDVVMCSHIDGEWIIQGFDIPVVTPKTKNIKIGKWSFQKLLVNSDFYFKDARAITSAAVGSTAFQTSITPDRYETSMRLKYYMDLFQGAGSTGLPQEILTLIQNLNDINKIAKINLYTPQQKVDKPLYTFDKDDEALALSADVPAFSTYDFMPNQGYIQSSIFDQVGKHMGGNNDANIIGRTNVFSGPPSDFDNDELGRGLKYAEVNALFWGPLFPDGYNSAQANTLRRPIDIQAINPNGFLTSNPGSNILSNSPDLNKIKVTTTMFADATDGNLIQLPAEIATNGSIKGLYSTPLESLQLLYKAEREESNLISRFSSYLFAENRYSWLMRTSDSGNVYGLQPVQSSRLQFSPLFIELALHNYTFTSDPTNFKVQRLKDYYKRLFESTENVNGWGNMLGREGAANFPKIGPDTQVNGNGPIKGNPDLIPEDDVNTGGFSVYRSNFVGVVTAKNKFSATDNISFITDQYFGLPPRIQNVPGFNAGVTVLGMFLSWTNPGSTEGSTTEYAQWGSTDDNYNSFGTTTLHARVFEQWPDEQTIFDSRYFAVLHFNPLSLKHPVNVDEVDAGFTVDPDWVRPSGAGVVNVRYPRSIDKIESTVDFRIPTLGHPRDSSTDNKPIPLGTLINRNGANDQLLRPTQEWRINPIRRGQLLTKGGFRYYKRVIGLSDNKVLIDGGSNFFVGQEINGPKGSLIKITEINTNGAISNFVFKNDERGEGFMPSDFSGQKNINNTNYFGFTLNIPNSGGKAASFLILNGIVYDKLSYDLPPIESTTGPLNLTIRSNRGSNVAQGRKTSTVALIPNNGNKYDAFYHFHNDILHTVTSKNISIAINGIAQYVNLELSAG